MTGNKAAPGIIPRAIGDIFRHIDRAAQEQDIFFYVRLSYVELYNNNFRNLLEHVPKDDGQTKVSSSNLSMNGFFTDLDDDNHTSQSKSASHVHRSEKIEVRESQSAGVFLSGANLRVPVTSALEAFQLIAKGNKYRATAATNCNDASSRYDLIYTMTFLSCLLKIFLAFCF